MSDIIPTDKASFKLLVRQAKSAALSHNYPQALKDYHAALKLLEAFENKSDTLCALWVEVGNLYLKCRQPVEALWQFQQFLEKCPHSPLIAYVYQQMAKAACQQADWQQALGWFKQALELPVSGNKVPQRQAIFFQQAKIQLRLGHPERAIESYQRLLSEADQAWHPIRFKAALGLAELQQAQKNWQAASIAYHLALVGLPEDANTERAECWYQLGSVLARNKQYQDSEQAFEQAFSLYQGLNSLFWQAMCLLKISLLYLPRKQTETALNFAREAVQLLEGSAETALMQTAYELLAEIHKYLGHSSEAEGWFKRAQDLNQNFQKDFE